MSALQFIKAILCAITGVAATACSLCGADTNVNSSAQPAPDKPAAAKKGPAPPPVRSLVREWKLNELAPLVERGLSRGRNFDRGQKLYTEMACAPCHLFGASAGGLGPDLTGVASRFTVRDLLESIVEPSKVISDLYAATVIRKKDGDALLGRVTGETDETLSLVENMLDPGKVTVVKWEDIESAEPSQLSLMPEGLLNNFTAEEIQDLIAYLLSGGDSNQKMFQAQLNPAKTTNQLQNPK